MSPVGVGISSRSALRFGHALQTGHAKLWVLLVGVNQYHDDNLSSLQYCAPDCRGLAEALTQATWAFPNKEILIYHDFAAQSPRLATVRAGLKQIASQAQPQDTVLFYFSGHGILEPQSRQAFLCFSDTRKDDLFATGLGLPEVLEQLGECPARQQLVWLDACHSGGMTLRGVRGATDTSLPDPTAQLLSVLRLRAAQSKGFYALLSCDQNQRSWEFPELGHGVFTYHLMRGLRGEAADAQGVIGVDALYRYVYHQTLQHIDKTNQQLRLINQQKRGRGESDFQAEYPLQTPKRIVEGVGELIIGLKPQGVARGSLRRALVIDGLAGTQATLTLGKMMRAAGGFEVGYWPRPGRNWSEVREAIRACLGSEIPPELQSQAAPPSRRTVFLYLRGRIDESDEGETWLVLGDGVRLSRSWLRQELHRARTAQQIVVLDCPGARSLGDWVEGLRLGLEQGQCLLAAAAPAGEPDYFTRALVETLEAIDPQVGLPVAGWISALQVYLAGTGIDLHVWLSGAQGVIEVLPGNVGSASADEGLDLGLCPYMGLRAFAEEDAQYFYGRASLTQELVCALSGQALLAVVGASGSGKSSLVQAGLLARLRQGSQLPGSAGWWMRSFRPGAQPIAALARRLVDVGSEREKAYQQMQLEGMLH
ncbi:MAG: caspase family protein, partial [Gemmatimonadaceae bacterium]|nr:caspase family protein [Gloeobacterales cyanobacterium ES-bin-141]